jgi:Hsp70 protein/prolyl oligopeptidase family protein
MHPDEAERLRMLRRVLAFMPLVVKSGTAIDEALRLRGLRARDIDRVLLVGGTSKIPLVRRFVGERLAGKDPEPFDRVDPMTCVAREAAIRGASLLADRPDVDAGCIGITGISRGGYLTCIVAGLDDRLKVAVPVYGCGFLHENSTWLGIFQKMPTEMRKLWVENLEPSRYLGQGRIPVLFVTGINDFACA